MNTQIVALNTVDNTAVLLPVNAGKDATSRLNRFAGWLDDHGATWYNPDLATYRDDLLEAYKPTSASAHLSTIRARYKSIIADNTTRDALFTLAAHNTDDLLERKAFVDEMLTRLQNAVNPIHSSVKTESKQDRVSSEELRLTPAQAGALMRKPGTDTLRGLRDTAILALALATGLREAELAALTVDDLRQHGSDGATLGVYVRQGKGAKSRFVPYGDNEQVLTVVDKWLSAAGITSGRVFRGFRHHSKTVTEGMTTRAIQDIFKAYPVMVSGNLRPVKPHDARRTYAKLQFDAGMDINALRQNLGHSNLATTLHYIGDVELSKRKPRATLDFIL